VARGAPRPRRRCARWRLTGGSPNAKCRTNERFLRPVDDVRLSLRTLAPSFAHLCAPAAAAAVATERGEKIAVSEFHGIKKSLSASKSTTAHTPSLHRHQSTLTAFVLTPPRYFFSTTSHICMRRAGKKGRGRVNSRRCELVPCISRHFAPSLPRVSRVRCIQWRFTPQSTGGRLSEGCFYGQCSVSEV